MVERAEAVWREALARYTPPVLNENGLEAAERVQARARKRLL